MTASSFATGRYAPSEGSLLHRGRFSKDGQDTLILVCHGRTPLATNGCLQWSQIADPAAGFPHLGSLSEHGYAILCIDSGGNLTWGNNASLLAAEGAVAWARSNGVCHPTRKIVVVGYSMGGLEAHEYAHAHPSEVGAILGYSPATDIDFFHPDSTFGPEIDAAWPSGYGGHSPVGYASSITIPECIWHPVDDTVIPVQQSRDFVAALGSPVKQLVEPSSGGHASPWRFIDPQQLLEWLGDRSF